MKILVVAGGTGGHVFPALCVANNLRGRGHNVVFATDHRGNAYLSGFSGLKVVRPLSKPPESDLMKGEPARRTGVYFGVHEDSSTVSTKQKTGCGEFGERSILNIRTFPRRILYLSLLFNTIKCFWKLLRDRPDCVVGFGGYPSVPFALAAQLLFIKTIIHEQNAVIGKANKLLSFMAHKIITSFPDVLPPKWNGKSILIGNPTRFEKEYGIPRVSRPLSKPSESDLMEGETARRTGVYLSVHQRDEYRYLSTGLTKQKADCGKLGKWSSKTDVFTILIFGGSQGASIFAGVISDTICILSSDTKLKVYHQARSEDVDKIREKYKNANLDYEVSSFFENINILYKQSDLVISRSGASSIFEIIGFMVPAILIPYKKSINGDQLANARFLQKHDATIVVDEDEITAYQLLITIKDLIQNPQHLERISQNLAGLYVKDITIKCADAMLH
ncbi:MAG: UDP-N-acetylglucosamine--N-acetylmuramyl-(pentapeptide) pyrophosphoryl-undecaprenol N-acetylglucosamine transferase [Holosporales bacterium]|jgi:UDP-N-acetylglucosamine--N-acetylmuramyl-(pentapeptide) pyrophosphoryl-undecaprenol N-acetylglucosamine transferase|nr:UDP-N-acetylglucosamine--N-acetylmuramyl-(pentapeptide) pyrophosphoryl-undecaprenol N-acetylglucosamine transferase [Holosporales bacterium]